MAEGATDEPVPPLSADEALAAWAPLADAFAGAPALVAIVREPAHRLVYANASYDRTFGIRSRNRPAVDVFPDLAEQGFVDALDGVYRTGQAHYADDVALTYRPDADGRGLATYEGWFTLVYAPLRVETEVVGVLIVMVDVTEKVAERRRLVEATERLAVSDRRNRDAALTLQRSLLPPANPSADGLGIVVRYLPAGAGTWVGGDWYDVIDLGAGRIAVVIGDVMGRGTRAAAAMGQLRAAIRAYARLDLPPGEILDLVDGLVSDLADNPAETEVVAGQIVTCIYAVYEPSTSTLTWANAGHLPPVLLNPDGSSALLSGPTSPPLGAGSGPAEEHSTILSSGSTVALYTDGLVEDRRTDIDVGIDRLRREVARLMLSAAPDTAVNLDDVADGILASLVGDTSEDDTALVLVHLPVPDEKDRTLSLTLDFPGRLRSVSTVRHRTVDALRRWSLDGTLIDAAALVVDELAANAVVHGEPPLRLHLRLASGRLIIEVTDHSGLLPRRRRAKDTDENGRGLQMVDVLCSRWGARPTADGKSVWAELIVPADPGGPHPRPTRPAVPPSVPPPGPPPPTNRS